MLDDTRRECSETAHDLQEADRTAAAIREKHRTTREELDGLLLEVAESKTAVWSRQTSEAQASVSAWGEQRSLLQEVDAIETRLPGALAEDGQAKVGASESAKTRGAAASCEFRERQLLHLGGRRHVDVGACADLRRRWEIFSCEFKAAEQCLAKEAHAVGSAAVPVAFPWVADWPASSLATVVDLMQEACDFSCDQQSHLEIALHERDDVRNRLVSAFNQLEGRNHAEQLLDNAVSSRGHSAVPVAEPTALSPAFR